MSKKSTFLCTHNKNKNKGTKYMMNTTLSSRSKDETATVVASICGVTARYVRMVVNGDRNNDEVLATYLEYKQGKNNLIKEIEKIVPLEGVKKRKGFKESNPNHTNYEVDRQ